MQDFRPYVVNNLLLLIIYSIILLDYLLSISVKLKI